MRGIVDISRQAESQIAGSSSAHSEPLVARLVAELESNGIVALPSLVTSENLAGMRRAFQTRLRRLRWNNFEGYQKTERYRHMVEDVLLLDQGFVDVAIHPLVKSVMDRYLGNQYALTEAKGWKSIPTRRDFHGWHGDAWYDQKATSDIPREIKLAMYLTDVRSGAFNYIRGSHRKQHPRMVQNNEVKDVDKSEIAEMFGPAGTAFLFDTSGIHRQGVPMLEPREAIFYNYHDPNVRLQEEDVVYYRYHPLLLNAAFLGNLSGDDQRILGFGEKRNFLPAFERSTRPSIVYTALSTALNGQLFLRDVMDRVTVRVKRIFN
jgi:hypothetical protein